MCCHTTRSDSSFYAISMSTKCFALCSFWKIPGSKMLCLLATKSCGIVSVTWNEKMFLKLDRPCFTEILLFVKELGFCF